MSLSPVPFLRLGFAILALSVALAVWLGGTAADAGAWRAAAGLVAVLAVTAAGEIVLRRARGGR